LAKIRFALSLDLMTFFEATKIYVCQTNKINENPSLR